METYTQSSSCSSSFLPRRRHGHDWRCPVLPRQLCRSSLCFLLLLSQTSCHLASRSLLLRWWRRSITSRSWRSRCISPFRSNPCLRFLELPHGSCPLRSCFVHPVGSRWRARCCCRYWSLSRRRRLCRSCGRAILFSSQHPCLDSSDFGRCLCSLALDVALHWRGRAIAGSHSFRIAVRVIFVVGSFARHGDVMFRVGCCCFCRRGRRR